MWGTLAIVLLSLAIIGLSYGLILQKWRMDALQHVLETHIMMDNQTLLMLNDILDKSRKEQANDSNG